MEEGEFQLISNVVVQSFVVLLLHLVELLYCTLTHFLQELGLFAQLLVFLV